VLRLESWSICAIVWLAASNTVVERLPSALIVAIFRLAAS
jgi:hypothetical protein